MSTAAERRNSEHASKNRPIFILCTVDTEVKAGDAEFFILSSYLAENPYRQESFCMILSGIQLKHFDHCFQDKVLKLHVLKDLCLPNM